VRDCGGYHLRKGIWRTSVRTTIKVKEPPQRRVSWLTLVGYQVPTKATLSLPSLPGQRTENMIKGSWFKIRTGRDHSPITITG